MNHSKEDYDKIPVFYCRRCTSLLIKTDEHYGDYCADCGSTDIGEISIEEWETLHKEYLKNC